MSDPTQTCKVCGRVVTVDLYARGFPPDAAARKLAKLCKTAGHTSQPEYLVGGLDSFASLHPHRKGKHER